jgi:hypothetical protein
MSTNTTFAWWATGMGILPCSLKYIPPLPVTEVSSF